MLFSFLSLFSQTKVQPGVKAGMNIASVYSNDGASYDPIEAFYAGLYFRAQINEKFKIQPEILVSGQGTEAKALNQNIEWKSLYLNVPIMAQYFFNQNIYAELGPQFGFLLDDDGFNSMVNENLIKTFDFGINAGLGYEFDSGLNVNTRYTLGLNNIDEDPLDRNDKTKNRVFSIGVGYTFKKR